MRVRAVIVWAVTLLLALLAPEGADASQSMSTYARWIRVDYYGALNVTSSANATEIRGKYRRLALQYHPDKLSHLPKSTRRKAEENFKIIAEGKEVLRWTRSVESLCALFSSGEQGRKRDCGDYTLR